VSAADFAAGTATITAPSSGMVLARTAEPGQVVAAGTQVVVLGEAAGGIVFRAPMIDADIARLRVGMPAVVRIPGLPRGSVAGRISEIDGRADPGSGTFEVTIALPMHPALRSGQIGTAEIPAPAVSDGGGLAIPASAVFNVRADEGFVYVVDPRSNQVHPRVVTIGTLGSRLLTITGGLKPGERIVASGLEQLFDGARIRPVGGR